MKQKQQNLKQTYFKKWQNKKYSVFNSLGRVIKICPLAMSYSLILFPFSVKGENDSITVHNPEYELEEVTVAGSRSPLLESEIARIIHVIPVADITCSPAQCISDYLDYLPGIDVRTRGPYGVQSDIGIRGGNFEQTTVLLNGVRITDPQTAHNSMNLPVDLNNISRIELIKGPASRFFGTGAFNGALNIVCKPDFTNYLTGSCSIGENRYYNAGVLVNVKYKNSRHLLSCDHYSADGYIYNTDFSIYNIYYNNIIDIQNSRLSFQTGYQDKAAGAQNYYSMAYPVQFEKMRTKFASLTFETGNMVRWKPLVYIRRGHDRFELFREGKDYYSRYGELFVNENTHDTASSWYKGHNYHLNTVAGFENNLSCNSFLGTSTFGVELRSENILSNTMGTLCDSIKVPGEAEGYFYRKRHRNLAGIYFEHKTMIRRFMLNGGILLQRSSDFGWQCFPGMDITCQVNKKINLFANVNKAVRLPSYTELYYNTGTHISDPDLKPEHSVSIETGARMKNQSLYGYVSIFYIHGNNLIDWVQDTGLTVEGIRKWESRNISRSNTSGAEVYIKLDLSHRTSAIFLPVNIHVSYTFINKKISSGHYISAYTLDYLRNKINIGSEVSYKHFYFNINALFQDRNDYYDWLSLTKKDFTPFILLDTECAYQNEKIRIYVSINNMLNKTYYDYSGIEMPGRFLKLGISKKFIW